MKKNDCVKYVAISVIIIIALCAVGFIANDTPNIVGYNTYVVSNGDTLWDIAKLSNGYGDVEHQQIVYDIREASDITPYIHQGDVVQIPIYEED